MMAILICMTTISCQDKAVIKIGNAKTAQTYDEQHRPQYHFTPSENWMNDPNGMFYHEGSYHLFYQYYPDSTVWGPMHWGHAKSTDLVHWEHLPIALYPDSIGCIFSGGAVVDVDNTSGLGTGEQPPIIATFTHHDFAGEKSKTNAFQKQSIAYSLDGGSHWIKYDGNPVIPNRQKIKDFRDPKVVWHPESKQWILVLAAYDKVKFYASSNLLEWTFISDFGIEGDTRLWECPDLFPLSVEGSSASKWVLIVSIQKDAPNEGTATSYFVGDFDGKQFLSDTTDQKWLDYGADNYAFVTWNNIPKEDGRTIGIGWMSNWQYAQVVPTDKWRSAMTIPRELRLIKYGSDYTLNTRPVKELEALRKKTINLTDLIIKESKAVEGEFTVSQCEIMIDVDLSQTTASSYGLKLENDLGEYLVVTFDQEKNYMYVDRTHSRKEKFSPDFSNAIHDAPLPLDKEQLKIRLFIDATSIEIFLNDGVLNFTDIFFPTQDFDKMSLFTSDGEWMITDMSIHDLESIWSNEKGQNKGSE